MGRKNQLTGYGETGDFYFSNEWRINASYNIQKIGMTLNLFTKINGKLQMYQYDYLNNDVTLSFIDPFALMDFTVGKTFLDKKLSLTAGLKNILNVVNVNASINSGPHSSGSNSSSAGMGRSLFVGVKYSFN
jgi:outer membrane receptor for ferrienterochelin and colicins